MLRQPCDACARARHSCDHRQPRCSRCIKQCNIRCFYSKYYEPPKDAGPAPPPAPARRDSRDAGTSTSSLTTYPFGSLDPFDSYPPTNLPRPQVQRLIHRFLNKLVFQYYPLDPKETSNPFRITWWPLALADPALFHVSLLTACLDEEQNAEQGFQSSDLLMDDSMTLLRRRVDDASLAIQDGTINSVIVLAAIEFGKGNLPVSEIHIDGVKRLVSVRGGINSVRQSSPLTARMVSWISILIMGHAQFETQDDDGIRDGIPPIFEWQLDPAVLGDDLPELGITDVDDEVKNVAIRLRNVFKRAQQIPFPAIRIHDLACFVLNRLLPPIRQSSPISECIRYAIVLYMFIIQGPAYYPHVSLLNAMLTRLLEHLKQLESEPRPFHSLDVWLVAVGLAASTNTRHHQRFVERAQVVATCLQLDNWNDILVRIKSVVWLETRHGEPVFRPHWNTILGAMGEPEPMELIVACASPSSTDTGPLGSPRSSG